MALLLVLKWKGILKIELMCDCHLKFEFVWQFGATCEECDVDSVQVQRS